MRHLYKYKEYLRPKVRRTSRRLAVTFVLPALIILFMMIMVIFFYKAYTDRKADGYLEYLSADNSVVRNDAVFKIGLIKDESKLSNKITSIFFDDSEARAHIVEKIGGFLDSKDNETKQYTALTMGRLNHPSATPLLVNMLKKRKGLDRDTILRAVEALGRLKDPAAVPVITPLLNNDDLIIRLTTLWAIGSIGEESTIPMLTSSLNDKDIYVRHQAYMALKRMR